MITLTEPQTWTMIGSFVALMFGMLTVVSTLFVRVLRAELATLDARLCGEISGLRTEMNARFDNVNTEMSARFDTVDARFSTVNSRIDNLDRDVQALVKHTFGADRG